MNSQLGYPRANPKKRRLLILCAALLCVLAAALFGVVRHLGQSAREVTYDEALMYRRAAQLLENGYTDEAIRQMNIYCNAHTGDWGAWLELAGLCQTYGRSAEFARNSAADALEAVCLQRDATQEEYRALLSLYAGMTDVSRAERWMDAYAGETLPPSGADAVLSANNSSALIRTNPEDTKLIYHLSGIAYSGASLCVTGKNLYSGTYNANRNLDRQAEGFRTTNWFVISPEGKTLTLSGGFNRALWQFELSDRTYVQTGDESTRYRQVDSKEVTAQIVSTVSIPQDAVAARVMFADENDAACESLQERMQIEYGSFPTDYRPYSHAEIALPTDTAYDRIVFTDGAWKGIRVVGDTDDKLGLPAVRLEKGSTVAYRYSIDAGAFAGAVINRGLANYAEIVVTRKRQTAGGVYGVTWHTDDRSILLERTFDAQGLSFNYMADGAFASPYGNDFDSIYPWSEMRLCAIDENGRVLYEGDPGFARDGSAGNVFVKIPKHYVMRTVENGVETIAISAVPRDGFRLDPTFVTAEGEVDAVYVAAYLSSIQGGTMASASRKIPLVGLSLREMQAGIGAIGARYCEMDLSLLMTLQRLWLVETAVRNTQAVFTGVCDLNYFTNPVNIDQSMSLYAKQSMQQSNSILVWQSSMSRRFRIGDAVGISDYRTYDNANSRWITDIQPVADQYFEISFSGDPIDITKDDTIISHIAATNGATDSIPYHTGTTAGRMGTASFKYRNIENLWGNNSVALGGAKVIGNSLYVSAADGTQQLIGYPLPEQTDKIEIATAMDYSVTGVACLGFDPEHPLMMMPSKTGGSMMNAFGDCYISGHHSSASEYIVIYGGTWDTDHLAGLFNYKLHCTPDSITRDLSSRMMMR